jgi:hypothetical protein
MDEHYFDYLYDEYMDELYKEHAEEAIAEFTAERLQSYYIKHPFLCELAVKVLSEARLLNEQHPSAALVFAVISIETVIKTVLLKPVVYGLIHDASAAHLVTEFTVGRGGVGKFKGLLIEILAAHGGVDLRIFKREKSKATLWDEICSVQKARQRIVHQAEMATVEEAHLAIAVATYLVENVFPQVIKHLGLHLHDGVRICNDTKCSLDPKLAELLRRLSEREPSKNR